MYQVRVEDEHGVVLRYVFDLTRRQAVKLYWELQGYVVQLRYMRKEVIAERRS